jgi:predicted HicB family RNase H-like nuclease
METLEYNGYEGTAEVDTDRLVCRGKILFIRDLVTYESDTPTGLEQEFRDAVDDYLETCKELGKEPDRPFRGQFNVRVPPELHRASALRAIREDISINEVVVKALDAFLCASSEVSHHVHVTITDPARI